MKVYRCENFPLLQNVQKACLSGWKVLSLFVRYVIKLSGADTFVLVQHYYTAQQERQELTRKYI